ncbi:MAG: Nramp family divalent metal transporter [Anaerolineales bacterium]
MQRSSSLHAIWQKLSIGSAIALQLLFRHPAHLWRDPHRAGHASAFVASCTQASAKLESVVIALVGTIGVAFFIEILLGRPDWVGIVHGFVPSLPDATALYISIGILGATVMPHNLYLHSSLVQTRKRKIGRDSDEIKKTLRWNTIDTSLSSLNIAFFINAAILVMAASVFHRNGYFAVAEIQDAHRLLEPLLGASIAPIAFAIALLASGQSSTITGTLAGQIVMEGYLNLRIRPWLRRLITRLLAVIPAILVIAHFGENATGAMLVLSQVILSLQLPFAIIPLINAVADKRRMGEFSISPKIKVLAWVVAGIILSLNIKLIVDQIGTWIADAGSDAWIVKATIIERPFTGLLLLYVIAHPWLDKNGFRIGSVHRQAAQAINPIQPPPPYQHVGVALDFSGKDEKLLTESLRFINKAQTETGRSCTLSKVQ